MTDQMRLSRRKATRMHDLGGYRGPVDYRRRGAAFARPGRPGDGRRRHQGFTFLQISDSHMGFDKPANPNAKGTLEEAIDADQGRCRPSRPS